MAIDAVLHLPELDQHTPTRLRPDFDRTRAAQRAWASRSVGERLEIVRRFRGRLALDADAIARTAYPSRHDPTDTLTAEVLPLLEACRWLERRAETILAPRRAAGTTPLWLGRNDITVHRDPHGLVLVIGPGNYPIFLPGVQTLQALVAGNAVLLKPGTDGGPAARAVRDLLIEAGLAPELCVVLDESPAAAGRAIEQGVDKVLLTGSAATGRAVLSQLASRLTPATMELSGSDSAYVLPGADLERVAAHLAFALTLNGGATCIAPRRVFVTEPDGPELLERLRSALHPCPPVELPEPIAGRARALIDRALADGAEIVAGGAPRRSLMQPTVLTSVPADAAIVGADLFAPILVVEGVATMDEALTASAAVPYALGASVFGPETVARQLAGRIDAGTIVINDLIVPTADPRAPFAARRESGFGVTRGAEGLLELTRIRTVIVRSGRRRNHLAKRPHGFRHLLLAYARATHSSTWKDRLAGLAHLLRAVLSSPQEDRS